jgi:CubicO group peptidase (beta-lactamase class C family)
LGNGLLGGFDAWVSTGRWLPGTRWFVDAVASCGSGVTVAAFVGNRVVDVWTTDLSSDSLVCTWSAIKPVVGSCLLWLVDRGRIDLDDPVAATWPELGDDRLLVRHLLTGGTGDGARRPLVDWDRSVAELAGLEPDWPPGEVVCEHAMTLRASRW